MNTAPALPETIGRYQVRALLGRGAMATVYEALDPSLQRSVAIKVLERHFGVDADFVRRFLTEARVVARLSHPNIVNVFDLGEDEKHAFIVMELVRGRSLAERLEPGHAIPPAEALEVMDQLLRALAYVHQEGIVHRDIKPANVMLDAGGVVKLADFGVARGGRSAADLTQAGTVIGTPRFMAPELLNGDKAGAASDLFAAAALAYRMLCGRDAFEGDSMMALIRAVLLDAPPAPSTLPGSSLPPALDAVFAAALNKNPAQRTADATEFARALRAAFGDVPADLLARPAVTPVTQEAKAVPLPPAPAAAFDAFSGPPADDGDSWFALSGPMPPAVPAPRPFAPPDPLSLDQTRIAPLADGADPFADLFGPATTPAQQTARAEPARSAAPPAVAKPGSPAAAAPDGTMFLRPTPAGAAPPSGPAPPGTGASASGGGRPAVHLVVTASADARLVGRSTAIDGDEFVLGRDASCDLVVPDSACSRRHALIRFAGQRFEVLDLGSTNGSWLDGRRLEPQHAAALMFGAAIRIGDTAFTFALREDTTLPDLSGRLLAGRYRVERVIRASPKATVYAARLGTPGPLVALKVLSPQLAAYPGYAERVHQAAEAASRLQHPHICPLLDHGQVELDLGTRRVSTPYLCHSLLVGGSLAPRLERREGVPQEHAARWVAQLAAALAHAHRRGVVHGDLKPTSIALDEDDNVYLMDFAGTDAPTTGPLLGAPAFMAPELWQGAAPDEASDQFALAVLAYLLFTGTRPFMGQEDPEQRERNFRRGAAPAHEEAIAAGRPPLPRAVSAVLQRALAPDAGARHESVQTFADALAAAWRGGSRTGTQPRVFVSYRHEASAGWAILLARELKERHRISAFVDTQRLDAAIQFPAKLARAIEDCDVFVCLLAAGTLDSRWVREEIRLAHEAGRPMVPVFQESFTPPDTDAVDASLRALLEFDGVHLLDVRNIHVDHSIDDLAKLVLGTARGSAP